jgi:hypothetical protein
VVGYIESTNRLFAIFLCARSSPGTRAVLAKRPDSLGGLGVRSAHAPTAHWAESMEAGERTSRRKDAE